MKKIKKIKLNKEVISIIDRTGMHLVKGGILAYEQPTLESCAQSCVEQTCQVTACGCFV